jgi:hypothetical protein
MDVKTWFLLDDLIYIGLILWACYRMFSNYFIAFMMCVTAFSFFSYGTNGIRNGLATSVVILAISFYDKRAVMIALFVLASGIHKSVMLPVFAGVISFFYKDTRFYLFFWFICIFASFLLGSSLESFFAGLAITDDSRYASYLLTLPNPKEFSAVGFRWDFLLYSSVPIAMGLYTTVVRKQTDAFYTLLLNTYIISNSFWILIMRANFSNRFAYLSWFLYPLILIYPVLKFPLWQKQYFNACTFVFLHYMFTYLMAVK